MKKAIGLIIAGVFILNAVFLIGATDNVNATSPHQTFAGADYQAEATAQ